MDSKFYKILNYIEKSEKPLVIAGSGIKQGNCENNLLSFIKKNNIPFVTTWNSVDITSSDDINNLGIIGMSGQRGANKALFQADLLICLGTIYQYRIPLLYIKHTHQNLKK